MYKIIAVLVLVSLVAENYGQHIIRPTYRPPPRRPVIIRAKRDISNQEPVWINQDDLPTTPTADLHGIPNYIDDIMLEPNMRFARSLDSPSAKRSGGSHSTSSGSRDTGATHPGYNRRNARDTGNQEPLWLNKDDVPKAPSSADHPVLPNYIDDIQQSSNMRYARNIGSHRSSIMPRPSFPRPTGPYNPFPQPGAPRRPFPIYA